MLFTGNMYSDRRVKNDLYTTDPKSVRDLIELEGLNDMVILEPCVGLGHIAKELEKANNHVITNDLVDYGYPLTYKQNFLENKFDVNVDCIVMNPPFKFSKDFVIKALEISDIVYVFEKITFLEGIARYKELYSKGLLEKVYIYSYRVACHKNGDITQKLNMAYCWFKFNAYNKNKTIVEWIGRDRKTN